jgi:hypothetical protein
VKDLAQAGLMTLSNLRDPCSDREIPRSARNDRGGKSLNR